MQRNQSPFGFLVTGCCSALFGWAMLLTQIGSGTDELAIRGVAGALGALSMLVTEALWRTRPWAWRASLALALAYCAAVPVLFGAGGDVEAAVWTLVLSGVFVVPVLLYIHRRSRQLWPARHRHPRGGARLPAASPYPPAHVAAARAAARP